MRHIEALHKTAKMALGGLECEECGGDLRFSQLHIMVDCGCFVPAFVCLLCGLLHWPNGAAVIATPESEKAYLYKGLVHFIA